MQMYFVLIITHHEHENDNSLGDKKVYSKH